MARKGDNCKLKTKANSKIWDPIYPRVICCTDDSLTSTLSKSSWSQNPVIPAELLETLLSAVFELFGVDPVNVDFSADFGTRMGERVIYADIAVRKCYVLAYHRYAYRAFLV